MDLRVTPDALCWRRSFVQVLALVAVVVASGYDSERYFAGAVHDRSLPGNLEG